MEVFWWTVICDMTSLHRLTGTKPVQHPAALCGRFGQQIASWQSFVLLPRQTRIINFMPQQVSTSKRGSKQSLPSWTLSTIVLKSLHPYRGLISASQRHCWVSHALPETWKFSSGGASTILIMIITFEGINGECFCYPTFELLKGADLGRMTSCWRSLRDRTRRLVDLAITDMTFCSAPNPNSPTGLDRHKYSFWRLPDMPFKLSLSTSCAELSE